MPHHHHHHPDEGDLPFNEFEFDDETGTEITVSIQATQMTTSNNLPEGNTLLHGGHASWAPPTNPGGALNWQNVESLTVTLSAHLEGEEAIGSATVSSPDGLKSAHLTLAGVGAEQFTLTAKTGTDSDVQQSKQWPDPPVKCTSIIFTSDHEEVLYAKVSGTGTHIPEQTVEIHKGTTQWATGGFEDVTAIYVELWPNAEFTGSAGSVGAECLTGSNAVASGALTISGAHLTLELRDLLGHPVASEAATYPS